MEQVVRLLAQRLPQIIPVQILNVRILVGVTDDRIRIQLPQLIAAVLSHLLTLVNGLTAAACTAAAGKSLAAFSTVMKPNAAVEIPHRM